MNDLIFQRIDLLVRDAAVAEVELLARLLLREEEVEAGRLGAERSGAVEDPHADLDQIAPLLTHGRTQDNAFVGGMIGRW